MKVATVGLVGVAILAAQNPNLCESMILALPVRALQQDLPIGIARTDLNRCLSAFQHI